jgi:hypothetical protein
MGTGKIVPMKPLYFAVLLCICLGQNLWGDDYTCHMPKSKRLADFTLRIQEEGKAYTVTLKSGEKTQPPEEYFSKGAVRIESKNKQAMSLVFSGESITLKLDPTTKKGSFLGTFRAQEKQRRKSFSGEIVCD